MGNNPTADSASLFVVKRSTSSMYLWYLYLQVHLNVLAAGEAVIRASQVPVKITCASNTNSTLVYLQHFLPGNNDIFGQSQAFKYC